MHTMTVHQGSAFTFANTNTITHIPQKFATSAHNTGTIQKHIIHGIPLSKTNTLNISIHNPYTGWQSNQLNDPRQATYIYPVAYSQNNRVLDNMRHASTPIHTPHHFIYSRQNEAFTTVPTHIYNNTNNRQNTNESRDMKITWDHNLAQPYLYIPEYFPESQLYTNNAVTTSRSSLESNFTQLTDNKNFESRQIPNNNVNFTPFKMQGNSNEQNIHDLNNPQYFETPENKITNPEQISLNAPIDIYQRTRGSTLSQALNLIPNFYGSPEKLHMFCMAIRQVRANFGSDSDKHIFMSLASKLAGKAADNFAARLLNYSSIHDFLSDLILQYSNIGLADKIMSQLKLITQMPGKKAGDYGIKTKKLLNRLTTIYESAPSIDDNDRMYRKRMANSEALQHFTFDLRSPIDHQFAAILNHLAKLLESL
ncbi:hypothetical protein TSAR_005066 [Trichomalopsis sarcophagae]|uniref:Uncharacterized protein n=1 Tax=Trichomalopsis sarcophagae TaxID=543379 RepID=A0A232EP00_9HYME|nr:hypothetical protein TSAR_005066 [Trichomalopsis sarcophagae]